MSGGNPNHDEKGGFTDGPSGGGVMGRAGSNVTTRTIKLPDGSSVEEGFPVW